MQKPTQKTETEVNHWTGQTREVPAYCLCSECRIAVNDLAGIVALCNYFSKMKEGGKK